MSIYQGDKLVANNYQIDSSVYCVPIGSIIPYASTTLPKGFLLCDGSEISKTDYADLYTVIGDTFGTATDNTKFKLPDLRDNFVQGANGNLGVSKEAGLPNITGEWIPGSVPSMHGQYAKGAIQGSSGVSDKIASSIQPAVAGFGFSLDASKSNSIYGKSTTVQPPAVCLYYIIKATKLSDVPVDVSGVIDDNTTATDTTWSSEKINDMIPTSLPADGGNADTVNSHTVLSNVPANAKFTGIDDNTTTSTTETWSAKKINDSSFAGRIVISFDMTNTEETLTATLNQTNGAYLYWASRVGDSAVYEIGMFLFTSTSWLKIPIKATDTATTISFSVMGNTLTATRGSAGGFPSAGGVIALGKNI